MDNFPHGNGVDHWMAQGIEIRINFDRYYED